LTAYRDLLRRPALVRLLVSAGLGRAGNQMQTLTFLLLAVTGFHSPGAAGLIAMLSILPGVLLSPLAGTVLDRLKTSRCVIADYWFSAALLALMAVLAARHALSFPALAALAAVSALTTPLSQAGTRALIPAVAPERLWDRANALDSMTVELSYVVGPPAAGACFALAGPAATMAITAVAFGLAGLPLLRLAVPPPPRRDTASPWAGIRYVLSNPALRGSALSMLAARTGFGALTVALPVLTLRHLHASTSAVGLLWATAAVVATASHGIFGRIDTTRSERRWITLGLGWAGLGLLILASAGSLPQAFAGMAVLGSAQGPIDVTTLSLTQRRTGHAWLGRSFSITLTLASLGLPIGALIGGTLAGFGAPISAAAGGTLMLAAAVLARLTIPPDGRARTGQGGSARTGGRGRGTPAAARAPG
jgi:MFS family permease